VVRAIKIYEQKEIDISEMSDNNNSDDYYCTYQIEFFKWWDLKKCERKDEERR